MPIFNFGGGVPYATPVLNSAYPANVTQLERADGSAAFEVKIDAAGHPDSYSYQWYVNDAAVSGATSPSYTRTGLTSAATYSVYCKVTNKAGSVNSRTAILTVQPAKPAFSYSGAYSLVQDSTYQWRLKFLTSGVVNFSHLGCFASGIDVFCVGGGGSGAGNKTGMDGNTGGGGGGGYTTTRKKVALQAGTNYTITIGAGGTAVGEKTAGNVGGATSAFGVSASGGGGAPQWGGWGGNGGSGGGSSYTNDGGTIIAGGHGGYDGGNGGGDHPGSGQGSTTREFGESGGTLYAGGGGGAWIASGVTVLGGSGGGGNGYQKGADNYGGGGGGGGAAGGSGIAVIRDAR